MRSCHRLDYFFKTIPGPRRITFQSTTFKIIKLNSTCNEHATCLDWRQTTLDRTWRGMRQSISLKEEFLLTPNLIWCWLKIAPNINSFIAPHFKANAPAEVNKKSSKCDRNANFHFLLRLNKKLFTINIFILAYLNRQNSCSYSRAAEKNVWSSSELKLVENSMICNPIQSS